MSIKLRRWDEREQIYKQLLRQRSIVWYFTWNILRHDRLHKMFPVLCNWMPGNIVFFMFECCVCVILGEFSCVHLSFCSAGRRDNGGKLLIWETCMDPVLCWHGICSSYRAVDWYIHYIYCSFPASRVHSVLENTWIQYYKFKVLENALKQTWFSKMLQSSWTIRLFRDAFQ